MMNTTFIDGSYLLAGRYRPERLIGRGGMANVYLGTDTRLQRTVAIKVLRPEVAIDPDARYRFQKEAHAVSLMGHPSIVRVYDAGEENIPALSTETPIPFIIMEYINGKILRQLMDAGPFDPKVAVHVALGILDALDESHRAGIIHRDIKPGNVMITQSGVVKVCDFGIAHAIEDSSGDATTILGTAQYFSPEQAKGEAIDGRSDLYSTAVVLYEMLTAKPPFVGETSVSVAFQHVTQPAPRLASSRPDLSHELDAIVERGLAKDRAERFGSAREFAQALRSIPRLRRPEGDIASAEPDPRPVPQSAPSAPRATPHSAARPSKVQRVKSSVKAAVVAAAAPPSQTKDSDVSQLRPLLTSDTPPSGKSVKLGLIIAGGLLVVSTLVAGMLVWVMTLPSQNVVESTAIEVPNLTNAKVDAGTAQLVELGLKVTVVSETSDTVEAGAIIRTIPEAGIQVGEGEIITVVESVGPKTEVVPDLGLLNLDDAKSAIEAAGFRVGSITTTYSATVAKNTIISSDPQTGASIEANSVINLVVSNGLVKVPDVVGKTLAEANRLLSDATVQLTVNVTTDMTCSGQVVKSQSLAAGDQPQHSTITIVYCAKS